MKEIGAYEAKTRLSELLELVRQGESFTVTHRGTPVARLVPVERKRPVRDVIADLRRFRRTARTIDPLGCGEGLRLVEGFAP